MMYIIYHKKLFNRQKIHFPFHPGHRFYSKNERLGRLPYYYTNFFSFHFLSTATLNCNFFYFFCFLSQFIFHSLFLQGFLIRTHFLTAVFPAINHWFEEAVVETGDEFSIIYIFMTLFVNNDFKVQCF